MTQYSPLNVKLSNSRLNKFKWRIEDGAEVTLNLSSNLVGNSDNETNFPYKLVLANIQFQKFVTLLQMAYQLM